MQTLIDQLQAAPTENSGLEDALRRHVLQDLLLPGGIDGIETTQRVLERAPEIARRRADRVH
jgi:hypothetical protein